MPNTVAGTTITTDMEERTTVIPVETDTMHTAISTRFGKAPWFAFVTAEGTITLEHRPDIDTMQMLDWLIDRGMEQIVTAHIGPKPFARLQGRGVPVYNPGQGSYTLIDVVGMMAIGKLEKITPENLHRFYTDKSQGDPS